jgi:hypothetical protein
MPDPVQQPVPAHAQEAPDPAKIQQEQAKAQAKAQQDALKAQVALHSAAVDVAKAVSDAYYKIDAALTKMAQDSDIYSKLKAVRDAVFIQKGQAEAVVQVASGGQQAPPAQSVAPTPTPVTPPTGQPTPLPTPMTPLSAPVTPNPEADAPPPPAPVTASLPSAQAQEIWDLLQKGLPGGGGNLTTDGKLVCLRGEPIFKIEGGMAFGSWAGAPSLTVAANVNSLSALAGVDRAFALHRGIPSFKGQDVPAEGWIAIGPVAKAKTAGLPSLLQPRAHR